jgi:hypothetical protein
MVSTTTRKRTNEIASLRAGGEGNQVPGSAFSAGERIKLSQIPGVFDGFRENSGDEKTGKLVEVTIIKAGVSLNGLDYLPATLKEAAPLFEGVPIYSFKFGKAPGDDEKESHLPEDAKSGKGNVGNMVAQIKESWWDEDCQAIRALVAVFDDTTRTKLKNAFDQSLIGAGVKQPAFGLSIDAAGLKEGAGVTKIVRPESVDIVKKAAAGGGFDRLVAEAAEEHNMKPEEIAQLVNDAIAKSIGPAVSAAMKEAEGEEEAGGGGDALTGLRKMIEGASPDERKALVTRVVAMFREMGLAEASPEEQQREQMTEAVKGLLESHAKNPKLLKEELGRLVEANAVEPKDPTAVKLEQANARLREMAISRVLDTFKFDDGRTFHCMESALTLADLSGVEVSDDFSEVTGLTESLLKIAEDKPWMVKAVEEIVANSGDGVANVQEEAGSKPAPRGQEIRLQEEANSSAPANVKALQTELAGIDKMMADNTATDRDLSRRAIVGMQLKRARASA